MRADPSTGPGPLSLQGATTYCCAAPQWVSLLWSLACTQHAAGTGTTRPASATNLAAAQSEGALQSPRRVLTEMGTRLEESAWRRNGGKIGQMTEGSGALLECDRHLDACGHAPPE
ncbi:hypothetical protein NDU88_001078 [Pleurodeles waltl]|uniref:Uncharacterized protein n=1 Tax=Pleurodeles waltl TaxID=8319 RepID=A0AAV7V9X0_PLEWA|nr:hypothetical protein NDU88_001078 [Pleurodeles waltl]